MKKILYRGLHILSVILLIGFVITLRLDWLNYYEYMSSPFYIYVIIRFIEFIIPSVICIFIALFIKKQINIK